MRRVVTLSMMSAALLSACGGDSGDGSTAVYGFVPPVLNSQRLYSETIVDSANNSIDISYTDTVTAVNADGSYSVVQAAAGVTPIVVDGVDWDVQNETVQDNASGQTTAYSYLNSANVMVSCTETPHGSGPDYPLTVGMTWSLSYQLSCNGGTPTQYVQNGTVVDVEQVTVAAGTFNTLRLQSTLTWTDAQGTQRTQSITNWRDIASSVSVMQSISISYAGTLPTSAYALSREIQLTSD
jgi:hypothetical protein